MIQTKAYAKLNLLLDILGRKGSLHEMCMIMQSVSLYDELTFNPISELKVIVNVEGAEIAGENIIQKAYDVFLEAFPNQVNSGFDVTLKKNIPMGAGLAGGSSNAAAAVRVFEKVFKLEIEDERRNFLLLQIGSDVPFCYYGGTSVVTGRGEQIMPIMVPLPKYFLLVNPGVHISTKDAFADWDKFAKESNYEPRYNEEKISYGWLYYNAFEKSVFPLYPIIRELKEHLLEYGADGALMTGSGSTVFASFADAESLENSYKMFSKKYSCYKCVPVEEENICV